MTGLVQLAIWGGLLLVVVAVVALLRAWAEAAAGPCDECADGGKLYESTICRRCGRRGPVVW